MAQDGGRCEGSFEGLECCSGWGVESEDSILFEESSEGDNDARIPLDEAAVEIGEAEEGLEVSDCPWLRPGEDSVDFGGCHGDAVCRDDESEEFGRGLGEFALFCLGVEVVGDEVA